jgi:hypothetical protein
MEFLEQEFDRGESRYSSAPLDFDERYAIRTVRELLSALQQIDVDTIAVDAGQPGQRERLYPSPYKA